MAYACGGERSPEVEEPTSSTPGRIGFKKYVFLDLESTGIYRKGQLSRQEPGANGFSDFSDPLTRLPNKVPRITEIALISYPASEFLSAIRKGKEPRHGGTQCWRINPELPVEDWTGGEISGLTAEMLEGEKNLKERWPYLISFFEDVEKPICLLAHNGNGFDFRLLKDEMKRLGSLEEFPEGVFVADTIEIFRDLENGYQEEIKAQLKDVSILQALDTQETDTVDRGDLSSWDLNEFRVYPGTHELTPQKQAKNPSNDGGSSVAPAGGDSSRWEEPSTPSSDAKLCQQPTHWKSETPQIIRYRINGGPVHEEAGVFDRRPCQLPPAWGNKLIPQVIQYRVNGGPVHIQVVTPDPKIPEDRLWRASEHGPTPPESYKFHKTNNGSASPSPPGSARNSPGPRVKRKLEYDERKNVATTVGTQSLHQSALEEPELVAPLDRSYWSPAKRGRIKIEKSADGQWKVANCGRRRYGLKHLYNDLLGVDPPSHHEADADCKALMQISIKYGEEFVKMVEEKAIPWNQYQFGGNATWKN